MYFNVHGSTIYNGQDIETTASFDRRMDKEVWCVYIYIHTHIYVCIYMYTYVDAYICMDRYI